MIIRHPAKTRSFQETIVFTHHFGGQSSSTRRHQEFVNQLGFDCVSFNFRYNEIPWGKFWKRQLLQVLDEVPGDKIIYSFSSPSVATASAIVDEGRKDIKAWITDGGPFLEAFDCLVNYFRCQTILPRPFQIFGGAAGYVLMGAFGYEARVKNWMANFPKEVSILSIRSGQDKMVPVRAIDAFFATDRNLDIEKFELFKAEHLEGLKNFPALYKPRVKDFLLKHAHAINT